MSVRFWLAPVVLGTGLVALPFADPSDAGSGFSRSYVASGFSRTNDHRVNSKTSCAGVCSAAPPVAAKAM